MMRSAFKTSGRDLIKHLDNALARSGQGVALQRRVGTMGRSGARMTDA